MSTSLLSQILLSQNKQNVGRIRALSSFAVQPYEMLCWGAELSRTDYPELFAEIGTTFGAGDGSTTFNIPDLRGLTIAGMDSMGGFPAGRLNNYGAGHPDIDADVLGSIGGVDRKTLDVENLPWGLLSLNSNVGVDTGTTTGSGGSTLYQTTSQVPMSNLQPTLIMNYVINLGRNVVGTVPTPAPGEALIDEEFNGPFLDWVNVVDDYGADPTGLTDSTVAFQNMINDLYNGKTIGNNTDSATYYLITAAFIPNGTYVISDTLFWPGENTGPVDRHTFSLYGQDPKNVILKWAGPTNVPMLWFSAGSNSSFSRITFDGQGVAGSEGIRFEYTYMNINTQYYGQTQLRVQDCIFKDLSYGIRRSLLAQRGDLFDISIYRSRFYRCSQYGIYLQSDNSTREWWIRQCYFEECYIGVGGQPRGNITNFSNLNAPGDISATATYLAVDISISNGGSGYQQDDILTVVGGTGTAATAIVTSVDDDGAVTGISINTAGDYSVLPTLTSVATTVSPSGGTNCTLNLNMGINTIVPNSVGSGYTVAPYVFMRSQTGRDATATVSISGGSISNITVTNNGYNYQDSSPLIIANPGTAGFSVYDCVFNASTYFDIFYAAGANIGIRRNFSINSGRFLLALDGQMSIVGNRVVNPQNTDCFHRVTQYQNKSRMVFANNQVKSKTGAVGPIWLDLYNVVYDPSNNGDPYWNKDISNPAFVAYNNSFSVNYSGVFGFDSRYTNSLVFNTLINQVVPVTVPLLPEFPRYITRQPFVVQTMNTAQLTIDAAEQYALANPDSQPVIYIPTWAQLYGGACVLSLSVMPLIFPANVKMSVQGASATTRFAFDGFAPGYENVPYLLFRGPSKITVKNLAWDGFNQVDDNDRGGKFGQRVVFDNVDQVGSRIINDNCRYMPRADQISNTQIQFTDLTYRNFGDPYVGYVQPPIAFKGNVNIGGNGSVILEGLSCGYTPPTFGFPNITIGDNTTVYIRDCIYYQNYGETPRTFLYLNGNSSPSTSWLSVESSSILTNPNVYISGVNLQYFAHDIVGMKVDNYAGNVVLASSEIRGRMNIQGDSSNLNVTSFGGSIFVVDDNNIFSRYNGQPINILGSVDVYTSLSGWPNSYTGSINDAYYVRNYGHLYVWDGAAWQDVVGLVGAISTATSLPGYPSSYTGHLNDAYVTKDTHRLWKWDGATWQDLGGNLSMPSNYYFIDNGVHTVNNISWPATTPAAPLNAYWYDGAPSGTGGTLPTYYQTLANKLAAGSPTVYIDNLGDGITDARLYRVSGDITFFGNTYVV